MNKALFVLGLGLIFSFVWGALRHYNNCYSATLGNYSGWMHTQPRYYQRELEDIARYVRDDVHRVGEYGREVTLLTETDPLFTDVTLQDYVQYALDRLQEKTEVSRLERCGVFADPDVGVLWSCLEWRVARDDEVEGHQRAYFTGRGHTKFIVLFTAAPPEVVTEFGDPTRWLRDLRWHGPGIAYSF